MLKILHSADWHLGKRLQEYSRLPEQQLVLEEITEIAEREKVDLVLLAGDLFDTFNPSHEAVELFYKTLRRLSNEGKRPIVAISGNHDSTQFVSAPNPLAKEMGILFYSQYDQQFTPEKLDSGLEITNSASGFVELKLPQLEFPVRIILAPYANEVLLKTYLGDEDKEAELRKVLGQQWQKLADDFCDEKGVNLFMGHFFFMKEGEKPEAEPESERPILHVGGAQAIYTHLIPKTIQYAALGHLHRYHAVDQNPCPVVYSSSPLSYSFSEANQEKKVVLIEASPAQTVKYQAIPLKQGRPLYQKNFSNLASTLEWLHENPYCFVEVIFETETSIDAETRKAIMKAHDGIVSLIPKLTGDHQFEDGSLQAEDLGQDMGTLFSRYYQSAKGLEPNEEIKLLFNEIIGQTDNEETA
ncbi:exonuclease subunit SbcD [Echinicola sp. CAU 1574]|uniref:Nuclease SbcCD subunit D n=1 Tax=Echinicola arenosa TaxID=2774144 RepID=A0ABR9ALX0_9BACT|nr:exonuclease subunit SbcD [Echinicola arenosa]MBD8489810.1 exonuclease subunit SbcD [Echinicola arenosa]